MSLLTCPIKKGEYLIWAEVDEVVFEYNVCELCGVALGFESFILYNHAAASLCFALNSQSKQRGRENPGFC